MKLLTVAIPCYNSAAYMSHAIETLLTGGEDLEIIIVNDGSKDDTAKIAEEYVEKYPSIIRAIHQEDVYKRQIEEILAKNCNIPKQTLESDERKNLESLEQRMKQEIFGQDEAVESLLSCIKKMCIRDRSEGVWRNY